MPFTLRYKLPYYTVISAEALKLFRRLNNYISRLSTNSSVIHIYCTKAQTSLVDNLHQRGKVPPHIYKVNRAAREYNLVVLLTKTRLR